MVYFYRIKEDALAAAQAAKQQAEDDAKVAGEQKAFDAKWSKKLTSLPYMVANHDVGFKLVYVVCKSAGKNAKDGDTCNDDGSHDWSDDRRVPYHWFSDIQACEDIQGDITFKHPTGVKLNTDENFMSYCVPASKVSGHPLKGYQMTFALSAPDTPSDDIAAYADLRGSASQTVTVFKTFDACFAAMDATYSKTMKGLGADEDGELLSDKTKAIGLTANCVRAY